MLHHGCFLSGCRAAALLAVTLLGLVFEVLLQLHEDACNERQQIIKRVERGRLTRCHMLDPAGTSSVLDIGFRPKLHDKRPVDRQGRRSVCWWLHHALSLCLARCI